jgi:hypothetical protein
MSEKMMDEFDYWLIWFLKFVVAGILLVAYLLLIGQWISPEPRRSINSTSEVGRYRIGEPHFSQGTSTGVIENDVHFFCRDGKKYKL